MEYGCEKKGLDDLRVKSRSSRFRVFNAVTVTVYTAENQIGTWRAGVCFPVA